MTEIYNFTQDDLMTEDIFILDCHSEIYIWVGQQVDSKMRAHALTIGEVEIQRIILGYNNLIRLIPEFDRSFCILFLLISSEIS